MIALISNEFRKLATIRGPWVLIAAQLLLVVGAVSGASAHSDLLAPLAARTVLAHGGFTSLFALILGITAVAGEHRYRTITEAYLATPRRTPLILAKLAAYGLLGIGAGLASAVLTVAATLLWFQIKGAPLDLATAELWRAFVGIAAWNTLFAALGVGLGAIIANLAVAIAVALVWVAAVETVLRDLLGDLGDWLPFAAGQALGYAPNVALSQTAAALALVGYVAAVTILAVWITQRRDVT